MVKDPSFVTAVAGVLSLAWETPHAKGTAKKQRKKKKKKKKKKLENLKINSSELKQ